MGGAAHLGMQAKALFAGQRCWVGGAVRLGTVCKLSTFCPAVPECNAVGAGARLQAP